MNANSIALLLHIVGALGLFVAMGLEWTGLRQIRSALLPQQAYIWMGILKSTIKVVLRRCCRSSSLSWRPLPGSCCSAGR